VKHGLAIIKKPLQFEQFEQFESVKPVTAPPKPVVSPELHVGADLVSRKIIVTLKDATGVKIWAELDPALAIRTAAVMQSLANTITQ